MSDLTETEVLDRLKTSLREAIQASHTLAVSSRKGPAYTKLREHLLLIEGCCRQVSVFREDTRWLNIGRAMSKAHELAGGWLRGFKHPMTGVRVHFRSREQNPLFLKLAENLELTMVMVEQLRTQKTGRVGMILPDAPEPERRIGRSVQVLLPDEQMKNGLILPKRVA